MSAQGRSTGEALPSRLRDRHAHDLADRTPPGGRPIHDRDPEIPNEIIEQQEYEYEQRDNTPLSEIRRPTPSVWRRVLLISLIVSALLIAYYFVSLWQVSAAGRSDQARPVDAIVVMGAAQYDGRPSPQLAARLDHVVTLWPEGHAPLVVVTGGNQPGDRFTEAEASAMYLVDLGVPADAIVLEDRGSTSYESLERVAVLLAERTGSTDLSVLIVTDPYHMLRSKLIAEEVGLEAYGSATPTSVVTGARSLERHLWEAGGVAVGRVTGFGWLSDFTD